MSEIGPGRLCASPALSNVELERQPLVLAHVSNRLQQTKTKQPTATVHAVLWWQTATGPAHGAPEEAYVTVIESGHFCACSTRLSPAPSRGCQSVAQGSPHVFLSAPMHEKAQLDESQ